MEHSEKCQERILKNQENSDAQIETDDELSSVLEGLGTEGEGVVHVWRYQASGPNEPSVWAMVARIAARDFDAWTIGERLGPGRYRFDFKNSRGKFVKKAVERVIAAPPKGLSGPAAPIAPAVAAAFDPVSLLLASAERAERFQQAMTLALIQNLGHGSGGGAAGGVGLADIVAIMREARESAVQPTPPHETVIGLLREGMKLGRGDGERVGDDEGGGAMAYLPKLLDVVSRVLPPAGGAPAAAPAALSSPAASGDPVKAFLASYAPQIIYAASSGSDPMTFARMVVTMTPRPMIGALRSVVFASPMQRRQAFAAGAPELVPYASWIDRACEAARGFLTTRPAPFPQPAPSPPPVAVAAAVDDPEPGGEGDGAEDAGDGEGDDENEDGCDYSGCNDPNCVNPDHFAGCDDDNCTEDWCNDPSHFEDPESFAAAVRRRERAAG